MSKRAPALTTQLKNAQIEIESLKKKLENETQYKDTYNKGKAEAEAEIEQVHALLDVLPGAAGRKTEHEEAYHRKDIKMVTRLASYLAHRQS